MKEQKSKERNIKNGMNDKVNNTINANTNANVRNYVSGDSTPSSSGHKFKNNSSNNN